MTFDGEAFGNEIVAAVRGYLDEKLNPAIARIKELEAQLSAMPAPKDGAPGKDGRDAPSLDELSPFIALEVEKAVASLPAAKDGEPGRDAPSLEDLDAVIADRVRKAVGDLPPPKDGDPGQPGRDAPTMEDLAPLIEECVAKAIAAVPVPKDGEPGRDGVGMAGMVIDRDGCLIATMTNGEVKSLGQIVGKDGEPGEPGRDGVDGVGWEDMDAAFDGERTVTFRFTKGERVVVREFVMPVVLDRGVFKDGSAYEPGDGVTWGGSFWIAQEKTVSKPDSGDGWRLAVKRGRDGKDGILKAEKPQEPIKIGAPK
jgi:hypothetical protein